MEATLQESNKRQKMSQETNNRDPCLPPLPSRESNTTVFEYFYNRYFFEEDDTDEYYQLVGTLSRSSPYKEKLHDFMKVALRNVASSVYKVYGCSKEKVFEAFEKWGDENNFFDESNPPRMASMGYKIQDSKLLSHKADLEYFSERIEELFTWWDERNERRKYLGPYLCFLQSSGMGKTKLMYEYKKKKAKESEMAEEHELAKEAATAPTNDETNAEKVKAVPERVAVSLILLTSVGCEMEKKERVFDYALDLRTRDLESKYSYDNAADKIFEELDRTLSKIHKENPSSNRFVLLFDESPCLLETLYGFEAFLFRCVRSWLRETRRDDWRVAGVFAGADSRILTHNGNDYAMEERSYSSRDCLWGRRSYHACGTKVNPPFYQTMTMGSCLHFLDMGLASAGSEYARSVYYGRPLFAVLAQHGILDCNISIAFRRMLLLEEDVAKWDENRNTLIHFLSTRVPMGQTNMEVTSQLVAKGFANVSGYCEKSKTYQLAYFPDPVCARIAMCIMDEDFVGELQATWNAAPVCIKGKDKRWWTVKLKEILCSRIVRPEMDNFEEVVVGLYMLFSADLLRKRINKNETNVDSDDMIQKAYVHFSVSLDDWLDTLQSGGKLSPVKAEGGSPEAGLQGGPSKAYNECKVSVGFIQVCRNTLRLYGDSWRCLADQAFLKHVYESGTAFLVYHECPLLDMVIPMRIETRNEVEFAPMFVSIQCQASFNLLEAERICDEMKEQASNDELDRALCLLIVFGSGLSSELETEAPAVPCKKASDELMGKKCVTSRVIFVPRDDDFGLTDALEAIVPAEQLLFASHPFFLSHGAEGASQASRAASSRTLSDKYNCLLEAVTRKSMDSGTAS